MTGSVPKAQSHCTRRDHRKTQVPVCCDRLSKHVLLPPQKHVVVLELPRVKFLQVRLLQSGARRRKAFGVHQNVGDLFQYVCVNNGLASQYERKALPHE